MVVVMPIGSACVGVVLGFLLLEASTRFVVPSSSPVMVIVAVVMVVDNEYLWVLIAML